MADYRLFIGNKNYSSWSMRPWVLMRELGIGFTEHMVRFDHFGPQSQFKQTIARSSPAGKVPVLFDGELAIWDTLAIAEYLAEAHPDKPLWPAQRAARARARSLVAEMHSGFGALRQAFPMNIEASLPEVGLRLLQERPAALADLQRIEQAWQQALAASGGPFLFGGFGIADAFFAPVVARTRSYALPLGAAAQAYADRVWACAGVQAWVSQALAEHDFVAEDEPYRTKPAA